MPLHKNGIPSFLSLVGLSLFFLWESCCYLVLPRYGGIESVLPLALLAHIGGVCVAGFGLGRRGEEEGWSARPSVILGAGLCGMAASFAAGFTTTYTYLPIVGMAFLAGLPFPLLLRQLFRHVSRGRQGLCLGTTHAVAESVWLLSLLLFPITAPDQEMRLQLLGILLLAMTCAVALSAWRSHTPPLEVRAPATPASGKKGLLSWMKARPEQSPRQAWNDVFPLLLLVAICFFMLHAIHDYVFLQNSLTTPGVPVWLRIAVRLGFPLLGILADRGYGTGLFVLSLGMSIFSLAMGLFPVTSLIYQFVYCMDTLGLHGGMIFLMLVFARCADRSQYPGLIPTIPYDIMHGKFALLWVFSMYFQLEFPILLLLSLGIIAAFLALLPWLSARSALWHPGRGTASPEPLFDFAAGVGLSPRETDVLSLIRQGLSSADMARRLCISENTLKVHVGKILKKTGARNRTHLMSMLMREISPKQL